MSGLAPERQDRSIVVTGAGGFVGRNLVPYLEAAGHRVKVLSLRDSNWKACIPDGARAFVHLAGLAHDLSGARADADYFRVNTELTRATFEAFLASGAKKFIFLSSVKASADFLDDGILTEDRKEDPRTPYGRSKLEAERSILDAGGEREGIYILRPCMIHGPGNRGNLNLLYRWVSSGISYPLGGFANARSFLSVENLNFVVGELCTRPIPSGVYNLADDEPLSTLCVVEEIAASIGRGPKIWNAPPHLIEGVVRIAARLGIQSPKNVLRKLTDDYCVSNLKIRAALGKELPVSSIEGLRSTLASFHGRT